MPAPLNLIGEKFGRLAVVQRIGANQSGKVLWRCLCECGGETSSSTSNLRGGISKSCGCVGRAGAAIRAASRSTKHGHSPRSGFSSEYQSWSAMQKRCKYSCTAGYKNYGGRGITVCERWGSFESFLEDMGPKPTTKHSIDRIDPEGNYEPDNCRWATAREQAMNKRPAALHRISWDR